jgi:hypothetical protein
MALTVPKTEANKLTEMHVKKTASMATTARFIGEFPWTPIRELTGRRLFYLSDEIAP